MSKIERKIEGNFQQILKKIETGVLDGNLSATLEEASDFKNGDIRCSVRVFERYSIMGGNRISLPVTLFQSEKEKMDISAIATGGSQGGYIWRKTLGR